MNLRIQFGALKLQIGEPAPLQILLVRHGQSQTNVDKSLHGTIADPDIQLTDVGKEQAKTAGEFLDDWLRAEKVKRFRLYRSDYLRAVQTSEIIIDRFGSDLDFDTRMDERIRELEFGYSDAVSDAEFRDSFPHYEAYKNLWAGEAKYYRRRLGGESPADVGDRLRHFVGAMYRDQEKYGISTFVVVNHGLTSRVLAKILLKEDRVWYAKQRNPGNCAVRLIKGKQDVGYIHGGTE
ncbi:MAG: histidine phosphatase family protein [Pseudomonadota bacterium]